MRHNVLTTGPPAGSNRFYEIQHNGDGTADVYLSPPPLPGQAAVIRMVRGVPDAADLEEDIRARYYDWCASAEVIRL